MLIKHSTNCNFPTGVLKVRLWEVGNKCPGPVWARRRFLRQGLLPLRAVGWQTPRHRGPPRWNHEALHIPLFLLFGFASYRSSWDRMAQYVIVDVLWNCQTQPLGPNTPFPTLLVLKEKETVLFVKIFKKWLQKCLTLSCNNWACISTTLFTKNWYKFRVHN